MRCIKCGASMRMVNQGFKDNKIVTQTWQCTKCGDRITENMENRWVKW